jgi:hypothetical protein
MHTGLLNPAGPLARETIKDFTDIYGFDGGAVSQRGDPNVT